ncbi:hypothetical protein FRX31_002931, partial [Thalictrum thalictroides]
MHSKAFVEQAPIELYRKCITNISCSIGAQSNFKEKTHTLRVVALRRKPILTHQLRLFCNSPTILVTEPTGQV